MEWATLDICSNQWSARILDPGNSRRESASFFLARPRDMIFWSLDLVSKHESDKMESRLEIWRIWRKIIFNLVSKDCIFSREWKWDSKSKPITVLHRRKLYDMIFDKQGHEYSTSHQGGSRLVLWWSRGGWVDRTGVNCTAIAVWTLRQYILDAHKN